MSEKGWLASLIEHEVNSQWEDAHVLVDQLRKAHPGADPDLLVNELIDSRSRLAALVGVGTGALQLVPGVGTALSLGSVLPEAVYLAKVQVDVALVIALLYESSLTPEDVNGIIVSCLVLALGADFVKKELNAAAVQITRQVVTRAIAQLGERELARLLAKVGLRASKAGLLSKVPVVGIPLNAAMNYGQIQAFGWAVKQFLSPSFVLCGACGAHAGKLSRFCPRCGAGLGAVPAA
jgi:hypothetical protein